MNIGVLKAIIKDLPNDMIVCGEHKGQSLEIFTVNVLPVLHGIWAEKKEKALVIDMETPNQNALD